MLRLHLLVLIFSLICSCSKPEVALREGYESAQDSVPLVRWYSKQQVETGSAIYEKNCSECHGAEAGGSVSNWKEKLQDGSFPPPPLDGSAHAWHHSRSVLLGVINDGGLAYGGKMPAFKNVLEKEEKLAAIAYFQNFWDDETYRQWEVMGGVL